MSNEVILAKRTFCSDIQVEQKISTRHSTMTWITEIFSFKLLYVFWLMWYTGRNSNHRESSSSSKARLHEPFFNMWFSFWMCIFECNNSVFLFFFLAKVNWMPKMKSWNISVCISMHSCTGCAFKCVYRLTFVSLGPVLLASRVIVLQ